jgi:hypothetical protein
MSSKYCHLGFTVDALLPDLKKWNLLQLWPVLILQILPFCFSIISYKIIIIMIIKFFIISELHQQPDGQLQMQHKKRTKIISTTK